ncbi:MAG: tyrosine-protein phosphatase [Verrucomicrobia bacterium]|nr:tyrosine-protein phosphatase [Verrucomicrobiota bacterium]MCH8525752.1 tyrosine-protein phosphatase [Kiritimatiellia bacterium]
MHLLIPFFAGFFLLAALSYAWWQLVERRFTVVTPGQVYRSAAMKPDRLRRVVAKRGIRTVYDLRTETEGDVAAERAALEAAGCRYVNLKSKQVPDDATRARFLEDIGDDGHRPALIHCTHGEGRAVLFGALWLIEFKGVPPPKARKMCRMITTKGSTFDLNREKGQFLEGYAKHFKGVE